MDRKIRYNNTYNRFVLPLGHDGQDMETSKYPLAD